MTFTCPEYASGICGETRCGGILSNPRPDGFDENMNQLYTAACVFDGAVRYFYELRPDPSGAKVNVTCEKPIDVNVVSVAPSAGKSLRAAMKDPGGRPKKTNGGSKIMTQAEMAEAFGAPCNEEMVANWEARAAGKKRGSNPPDAIYNGERIVYSAELRLNPTPDNKNRLAALIAEYQSRHRVKEAVDRKNTLHMKSPETLAKASGQIDEALRRKS